MRNPTERPRVYARGTQKMLGDGPISLLIVAREFTGINQPV
jgi:hypothetical protein